MRLLVKLRLAEINLDRLRRGEDEVTDHDLALAAGVHVRTVQSLLKGDVERVDLHTLNGLIRALRQYRPELSAGDLLEYREDTPAEVAA